MHERESSEIRKLVEHVLLLADKPGTLLGCVEDFFILLDQNVAVSSNIVHKVLT